MASVSMSVVVDLYSWDACTFGWGSIECQKPWAYFGRVDYEAVFDEQLALRSGVNKAVMKSLSERVALDDSASANVTKKLNVNMLFIEIDNSKTSFNREFSELIIMHDSFGNRFDKSLVEYIAIDEHACGAVIKNLVEVLCITEDLSMQTAFKRVFVESLHLQDRCYLDFNKYVAEHIGFVEKKELGVIKNLSESLRIIDWFSRSVHYVREFIEKLCVGEQLTKKYGLNVKEALQVSTSLIRNCNAVLTNILLTGEELTEERFLERVNTAPGYNAFQDFSVGEYEFQRALVRIIISNAQTQSEPLIYDVTHHVDIDDVVDGGVVNIVDVDATTKVRYNKFYYNNPEVSVILKGGNTGQGIVVPRLLRTDGLDGYGRYFEVELVDERGTRVTGTISWTSRGY